MRFTARTRTPSPCLRDSERPPNPGIPFTERSSPRSRFPGVRSRELVRCPRAAPRHGRPSRTAASQLVRGSVGAVVGCARDSGSSWKTVKARSERPGRTSRPFERSRRDSPSHVVVAHGPCKRRPLEPSGVGRRSAAARATSSAIARPVHLLGLFPVKRGAPPAAARSEGAGPWRLRSGVTIVHLRAPAVLAARAAACVDGQPHHRCVVDVRGPEGDGLAPGPQAPVNPTGATAAPAPREPGSRTPTRKSRSPFEDHVGRSRTCPGTENRR